MSSSRSIAAARARRAGEQAPPVSGNRPVTSINSHAAFAPQQQMSPQYTQMPQPPANVRVARGQPQSQSQQKPQEPQQNANQLPFSKISISDAIGLITIRLGRVEQYIIDLDNEKQDDETHELNIPDNSKIIDSSVLNSIINRLDSIEKREPGIVNDDKFVKATEEIKSINELFKNLNAELVKTNLLTTKNTEQLLKCDKELIETKDLLSELVTKIDLHIRETNDKFIDYEYAISELEKNVALSINENQDENNDENNDDDNSNIDNTDNINNNLEPDTTAILSVDLKNIIKQELANV
jgi:hypothetical protein